MGQVLLYSTLMYSMLQPVRNKLTYKVSGHFLGFISLDVKDDEIILECEGNGNPDVKFLLKVIY